MQLFLYVDGQVRIFVLDQHQICVVKPQTSTFKEKNLTLYTYATHFKPQFCIIPLKIYYHPPLFLNWRITYKKLKPYIIPRTWLSTFYTHYFILCTIIRQDYIFMPNVEHV